LEQLAAKGEQESRVRDGKTYFIYELLMPSGKWPEQGFYDCSIGTPRLPTYPAPLNLALKESGIKHDDWRSCGRLSFYGICPVLLYVPGETPQQAKDCLDNYRNRIDEILDNSHQHCVFKVRPAVVGKHKYNLPH